jgi:hypothetical protein
LREIFAAPGIDRRCGLDATNERESFAQALPTKSPSMNFRFDFLAIYDTDPVVKIGELTAPPQTVQ